MYDFYENDEEDLTTSRRKRSNIEKVKSFTSDILNAAAPEKIVSLEDLRIAFEMQKKEFPEVQHCVVNVVEKKNTYVITLIMLDKDKEPIFETADTARGKKIVTKEMAENLVDFMGYSTSKLLV